MKKRHEPDRMALEIAHRKLRIVNSLDDVLEKPSLKAVVTAVARRHVKRRSRFDFKKAQAGDLDD